MIAKIYDLIYKERTIDLRDTAAVAQLDRVIDFGSIGCRFDSYQLYEYVEPKVIAKIAP